MGDEQIVELYDALWRQSDYAAENGRLIGIDRSITADLLVEHLEADLRVMGADNPARLRNLLDVHNLEKTESWCRALGSVVDVLVDYGYEFTRDSLLSLAEKDDFSGDRAVRAVVRVLADDHVSQEIKDDFEARLADACFWLPSFEHAARPPISPTLYLNADVT